MIKRCFGGLAVAIAAVACLGVGVASANNLDNRTATNYAKKIAKYECRQTTGCQNYFVRRLNPVSRHKTLAKIAVAGVDQQNRSYVCVRQIVMKLDHYTGNLSYTASERRCYT